MSNVVFIDFDGVLHPVGACVWDAEKQQMQSVGASTGKSFDCFACPHRARYSFYMATYVGDRR